MIMRASHAFAPCISPDMDMERFARIQDLKVSYEGKETEYERAIRELREGEKRPGSDCSWALFVFPRATGLGIHINSIFYGIGTMREARAYLEHPLLGPRLHEATEAVLECGEDNRDALFGNAQGAKIFFQSMTLFAQACLGTQDELFLRVILKFWGGLRDEKTLEIMESW